MNYHNIIKWGAMTGGLLALIAIVFLLVQKFSIAPAPTTAADGCPDWLIGDRAARMVDETQTNSEASWFASVFNGLKAKEISAFFARYGHDVTNSELLKIETNNGITTRTYAVYAVAKEDFYNLASSPLAADGLMQALIAEIELERGLPPGQVWDISSKRRVIAGGKRIVMLWSHQHSKRANTMAADLPRAADAVGESQIEEARNRYADYRKTLSLSLDEINRATNDFLRQRLALMPGASLEKFNGLSNDELINYAAVVTVPYTHVRKFSGISGSELLRTGQRVSGGEMFGRAAGSFGGSHEANLGAAAGMLAGFAYDWISKANDESRRKKEQAAARAQYDREVAAARAKYNKQLAGAVDEARSLFKTLCEKYAAQIATTRARPDEPLPVVQITDLDLAAAPR